WRGSRPAGRGGSCQGPAFVPTTAISVREGQVADLKKGARITGAARDKLATELEKKYDQGARIRALAEAPGRADGFVHRILTEAGASLRGRGGATRRKKS